MKDFSARFVAMTGMYAALAVVISAAEGMMPPLPFMPPGAKAGFSNIIVMFLGAQVGLPAALAVAAFKGVFALVTRGATAAMMSLVGGLLSATAVFLLSRIKRMGCVGLGVGGATAHNLGQLCVSLIITGGAAVYYLPGMLIFGIFTGSLTGILLYWLLPVMHKLFYGGNVNGKTHRADTSPR